MSRALGTSAATSSFSACSKSWRSFAEREMASKEFFADPRNDPRRSCWCVWCLCCCSDHHIESYLMTNFWVQSTFAILSIFEFLVLIFTECTKYLGALIGRLVVSLNQQNVPQTSLHDASFECKQKSQPFGPILKGKVRMVLDDLIDSGL